MSGHHIQQDKNFLKSEIFNFPSPMRCKTKRSKSVRRNQKRRVSCKHAAQKNPVQVGSDDKNREVQTSNFLFVNSLAFFLHYTFILVIFVLSGLLKTQKGTRSKKKRKIKEKYRKMEREKLCVRNRSFHRSFLPQFHFAWLKTVSLAMKQTVPPLSYILSRCSKFFLRATLCCTIGDYKSYCLVPCSCHLQDETKSSLHMQYRCSRLYVLTPMKVRTTVFVDVTPYSLVVDYQRFGRTFCFHLQGRRGSILNVVGMGILGTLMPGCETIRNQH